MRELHIAIEAAEQASQLIRASAGQVDATEKGHNQLVTQTDEAAQECIIRILRGAFPQWPVFAEEGNSHNEAPDDCWIVDPIDGTTNFVHRLPPYAVSIALRRGRVLTVGVVLDVASNELFTAIRGHGAFLNGRPIAVSTHRRLKTCVVATGLPFQNVPFMDDYMEVLTRFCLETQGVRRLGVASVDLAYVACGRFDGYFETGIQAWDVAAGILLVEEAGGRVTDYRGDRDPLLARQIVASNSWIHEEMLLTTMPLRVSR